MDTSLNKLRERVKDREAWRAAVHAVAKIRTRLGKQTAATIVDLQYSISFTGTVK